VGSSTQQGRGNVRRAARLRGARTAAMLPATNTELRFRAVGVQIMTLDHILLLTIAKKSYFSDNFKYQSDSLTTANLPIIIDASSANGHASHGLIYW
jgi:hypothetical protein